MNAWPLPVAVAVPFVGAALINAHVWRRGSRLIRSVDQVISVPLCLVLGARVWAGNVPSPMLADRLQVAADLWHQGRVEQILSSGDNRAGQGEVDAMDAHLHALGVPERATLRDEAGLTTHASLVRARDLFGATELVIVTQGFHLPRALYAAEHLGLRACGVTADLRPYAAMPRNHARESLARLKAFVRAHGAI